MCVQDITSPSEKSYEVEGWIELRRQRPFRSCDHGSGPAIWVSGEAQHAFDVKERAGASHATLKCEELFERAYDKGVLASDKRIPAPSTLMGKTTVQILNNFWSGAQDTLQEALRHYPWFWPASVCKSELLVLLSRWDEAAQCARNLLRIDEDDLDSHTVLLLHAVAQKGDLDQGVLQVRTFFEMLAVQEPYSFALWLDSARLFLSMVGIHDDATEAILSFLRAACSLAENNVADCQEQLDRANAQHKKRERLSPYHSLLLSTSKVRAGLKVDVADENVFVNLQEAMAHVDEAVSYTVRDFRSTFGLYFFTAFRANLLFDAASTYLDLACYGSLIKTLKPSTGNSVVELSVGFLTTATPSKDTSFVAEALAKASSVLGTLCHFMPGHGMAKAMMARVHLLQGDTEAARRTLRDALSSRAFSDDLGGTKSSIAAHFCLMLARLEQLAGQPAEGLAQLEKALSFDLHLKSTLPYYLIKADLHLQKTEFDEAVSTLEESQKLATVRSETPQKINSERQAADLTTTAANPAIGPSSRRPYQYLCFRGTDLERVELHCLLATAAAKNNRGDQAFEILSRASSSLAGSPLEGKIVLCRASIAADSGDSAEAARLLSSVPSSNPFYVKAQMSLAQIFLTEEKNRAAYARCFRDIAAVQPTPENFTAIGEALLEVYEPRGAVEAFERALHAKPGDRKLIRRIVAALVKTHQYERASTYASNSLREQPEDLELRLDLVALLFRLRRWQEAIETASVVDGDNTAYDGSFSLGAKVQILLLKVKALLSQTSSYSARGDEAELEDSALRTLHRCRVAIKRYLELHQRSAESASGEGAWRISRLGADVYCQLGAILERRKGEAEQAAQCFEEARELDSERTSALLALSRIRLRQGHLQAAEEYLSALQRLDPTNEGVSLIKSEIVAAALLDNVRHSPCDLVSHCFSLLRLHLPHFKALGDALALMRKQGLLIENYSTIITAIENLKQSTGSLYIEAGTNYCLGIIKRWRHFPHEALQHLNVARRHSSFYHDSMRHMVEICLDPGDRITVEALCGRLTLSLRSSPTASLDGLGGTGGVLLPLRNFVSWSSTTSLGRGSCSLASSVANDADQHTLSSAPKAHATNAFEAERLLQEWHAAGPPVEMRRRLMTWQIEALAFSKDRGKMDLALKAVGDLLLQHRDDVPLLLAAAETLLVMRQTSKARVHLKRIYELAKVGIDPIAEAETERASLLLAELHIQAGKTDNAIPLITLVTNRNKECARAWELLGMCAEKRGQYEQSADHYGKKKERHVGSIVPAQAWKLGNERNLTVGYRLADTLLKAKQPVKAITACHAVLRQKPDFLKIRKEVLDKARRCLRL
uniref:TPR Domain containing protein, putative n=1 Tax=Neospora caninum (strain Liverpool) TaxID=572307 RepID=A0A0F7UAA2_NEOCL|nr:TPA: TPR Domain containing protein, putative [Neospora caninum Liverpool]